MSSRSKRLIGKEIESYRGTWKRFRSAIGGVDLAVVIVVIVIVVVVVVDIAWFSKMLLGSFHWTLLNK